MFTAIFIGIAVLVVALGVNKGIERSNRVMMPLLFILLIAIAIYGLTLPGAMDGLYYFLVPDFSKFSANLVLAAMGQMFYSLSLAMGILFTYGSYLSKKENLESSIVKVNLLDTLVSVLAGLMIIPAVFAVFGAEKVGAGPGLMFITLPQVFESTAIPSILGAAFFLLVFFAASTSAVSLLETVVSIYCDAFKMSRSRGLLLATIISLLLACPASLGFGPWESVTFLGMQILDFMDFISNSVLMPIAAFLTCVFVGWIIKTQIVEDEVSQSSPFVSRKAYRVMVKYIAPILMVVILVSSVLSALGLLKL